MNYVIAGIFGFIVLIGVAIYFDSQAAIPTQEEIQNLERALPKGCTAHDVGSYGRIDNLIVIECENRTVTSTYAYKHEQHGKTSETDRSAVFVIR